MLTLNLVSYPNMSANMLHSTQVPRVSSKQWISYSILLQTYTIFSIPKASKIDLQVTVRWKLWNQVLNSHRTRNCILFDLVPQEFPTHLTTVASPTAARVGFTCLARPASTAACRSSSRRKCGAWGWPEAASSATALVGPGRSSRWRVWSRGWRTAYSCTVATPRVAAVRASHWRHQRWVTRKHTGELQVVYTQ